MSDFQPGAYDVEREVFSGKFRAHLENRDGLSLPEQMALANQLFDHFGAPRPEYRRRDGRLAYDSHFSRSKGGPHGQITFGALAGTAIVCHEVAHALVGADDRKKDGYGHGPTWQAKYVACVEQLLGAYHARRLATGFAKFEADKARNMARAAKKRGQRRSSLKSGPRVRTVVKGQVPKLATRAMGDGVTLTWGVQHERIFAVRYRTNKGGYWMVSAYDEAVDKEYGYDYLGAARGEYATKLFTERRFSTKVEALEWGVLWCQQRQAA